MNIKLASIIAGVIILFSFQNCQKSPYADEISSLSLAANSSNGQVDLSKEALLEVNVVISEKEIVTKNNQNFEILVGKNLSIDLSTGVIQITSDLGSSSTACLTESLKQELVSILKSAQICKSGEGSPNQMCTQAIVPAYAQIKTSQDQYDLGFSPNGCGNNVLDLCGEQASLFQGYIQALKNQYKNLNCN